LKRKLESLEPQADSLLAGEVGLVVSGAEEFPYEWVVGLDEVGMGCLAGPVVAACFAYRVGACAAPAADAEVVIGDSKALSERQRIRCQEWIESAPASLRCVHSASPAEIDEINILRAAQLAMERAFLDVWARLEPALSPGGRFLLYIDGNKVPAFVKDAARPWAGRLRGACVVKGDARSFAVACASILAKQHRDDWMRRLDAEFPGYGWASNVGYPAPAHKRAIAERGLTPWHRRSFRSGAEPV
jgi:ribonuclease HII